MDRVSQYHAGEFAAYGMRDVELTGMLWDNLRPKISEQDLDKILELESKTIWPICYIERHPPRIDFEKLELWQQETKLRMELSRSIIRQELDFVFEPTPKKWTRLFKETNTPLPIDRTPKGKVSFKSENLKNVAHPLIREGLKIYNYGSLRSKFLLPYENQIRSW